MEERARSVYVQMCVWGACGKGGSRKSGDEAALQSWLLRSPAKPPAKAAAAAAAAASTATQQHPPAARTKGEKWKC